MRFLMMLSIPLILIGCGKAKETAQDIGQRIKAPELMHTYQTDCSGSGLLGLSMRTFYQFKGNKVYKQHDFYQAGDCTGTAVATVQYIGDLDVQDHSSVIGGARNLHLHWNTVSSSSTNATGAQLVAIFPKMKVPSDEYNLVKVDDTNKVIQLGLSLPTTDLSNPDHRPTKLGDYLHQVNKDLDR